MIKKCFYFKKNYNWLKFKSHFCLNLIKQFFKKIYQRLKINFYRFIFILANNLKKNIQFSDNFIDNYFFIQIVNFMWINKKYIKNTREILINFIIKKIKDSIIKIIKHAHIGKIYNLNNFFKILIIS